MIGAGRCFLVILALVIGCDLAAPGPIFAADDLAYAPPQAPAAPSPGPVLVRLFGMTTFVLLLCAGMIWFLRYIQRPRLSVAASTGKMRLLESTTLNGRCSVHLILVGGSRVLAAVDASGFKSCQLVPEQFEAVLAQESTLEPEPKKQSIDEIMRLLANVKPAA